MSEVRPAAWKRAVLQLQTLAAVLPLLCLTTVLARTASVGFAADRDLYPRTENDPELIAEGITGQWGPGGARGRVLAVWGLDAETPDAGTPGVQLLHRLAAAGIRLRLCAAQARPELLPPGTALLDTPAEAAQGAHAIVLQDASERFVDVDLDAIAATMVGNLFFDLTGRADGLAVDRAGLQVLAYGVPLGPPWLDPELQAYAEHLRARIPPEDGILLVPALPPGTIAGRARWFLHLNYKLFPRRLYLQHAAGASGTSVQFRRWVFELGRDFPSRTTRRWEPSPRELSRVTRVGPARTLTEAERRAIEEHDVQWVSFFTMNEDFRLQDWETMTAAEALAGPPR